MIKDFAHAQAVCNARKAAGRRGLPRAVVHWMRKQAVRDVEPSREARAQVLGLVYNAPI